MILLLRFVRKKFIYSISLHLFMHDKPNFYKTRQRYKIRFYVTKHEINRLCIYFIYNILVKYWCNISKFIYQIELIIQKVQL